MSARYRLEDAFCTICHDQLFENYDDVEEEMPIAAPDCGHVFHQECLQKWFRNQEEEYIDRMAPFRAHGDPPYTAEDAPVECPTCRTECMADIESGVAVVHRLFITFREPEESRAPSPEQDKELEQSVSERREAKNREREESERFGLARGAKGMTAEVDGMNAHTAEEDVDGMVNRAKTLRDNMIESKAAQAYKKYAETLSTALDNFSARLTSHPLIATMKEQAVVAAAERERLKMAYARELSAYEELKKKSVVADRQLRQAQDTAQTLQREYNKEKVARKESKKQSDERINELVKAKDNILRQLQAEVGKTEELEQQLSERTRQLKRQKQLSEARKGRPTELEELRAENERLQLLLSRSNRLSTVNDIPVVRRKRQIDSDDESDSLIEEQLMGADSDGMESDMLAGRATKAGEEDESLQIDMPSFSDPSERRHVKSVTASTYVFDQSAGFVGASTSTRAPKRSRFFHHVDSNDHDNSSVNNASAGPLRSANTSRTNPFPTTRDEAARKRELRPSPLIAPRPVRPHSAVANWERVLNRPQQSRAENHSTTPRRYSEPESPRYSPASPVLEPKSPRYSPASPVLVPNSPELETSSDPLAPSSPAPPAPRRVPSYAASRLTRPAGSTLSASGLHAPTHRVGSGTGSSNQQSRYYDAVIDMTNSSPEPNRVLVPPSSQSRPQRLPPLSHLVRDLESVPEPVFGGRMRSGTRTGERTDVILAQMLKKRDGTTAGPSGKSGAARRHSGISVNSRNPLQPRRDSEQVLETARVSVMGVGTSAREKGRSTAQVLGIADRNGRPVKGAVSGAKMKRRA